MKKVEVQPNAVVRIKKGSWLDLDPHLCLSKPVIRLPEKTSIIIETVPRRVQGITLVRVKINSEETYECYYCDIINNCEGV